MYDQALVIYMHGDFIVRRETGVAQPVSLQSDVRDRREAGKVRNVNMAHGNPGSGVDELRGI